MDEFNDLHHLLSLKRHEAPPEDFFDGFMRDFHQAQRAEMLKRSVWRIALDRLETFWPSMPVGQYAYAGSCALALLAAGVTSARILSSPVAVADAGGSGKKFASVSPLPKLNFFSSRPATGLAEVSFDTPRQVGRAAAAGRPRYVLDSQPVSYEQPFSF